MERYFNNFATSVAAGGYTSGSGVLNVGTTSGVSLNSGDTCRLAIYNGSTLVVILIASAVNSGTQFAVTAEGTDASASSGFAVLNVLTVGGMNQIRSDLSLMGSYVDLPSPGSNFLIAGQRFKQTDGPYEWIFNGTTWVAFLNGFQAVLPIGANYTWANQGGATIDFTSAYGLMAIPASGSTSLRVQYKAQPSTPYTIDVMIAGDLVTGNSNTIGIGFYDSVGGALITLHLIGAVPGAGDWAGYQVAEWNSVTSFHASVALLGLATAPFLPVFLRIANDGTNLTFYIGNGLAWYEIYTQAVGTWLTPDSVFWFGNSQDSNPVNAELLSWYQH